MVRAGIPFYLRVITMKILKIITFLIALTLASTAVMAQQSKVGFLNPQRVIMESKVGRIAQEDLARLGQEKDKHIRKAREKVEDLQIKLETGTLTVNEEGSLEKSLRLAIRDYEQLVESSTMELKGEERRLVKFIMQRADTILRRLAKDLGFTMILTDPEAIGYVADSMDITDRVIRELNTME